MLFEIFLWQHITDLDIVIINHNMAIDESENNHSIVRIMCSLIVHIMRALQAIKVH